MIANLPRLESRSRRVRALKGLDGMRCVTAGCSLLLLLGGCVPSGAGTSDRATPSSPRPCAASTAARDSLIHDSASVTAAPDVRSFVPLQYPDDLRKDHIQGRVVLWAWISATGAVDSVAVDSASNVGFIGAAVTAVRGATFWPACVGDRPVRYLTTVPVTFLLGGPNPYLRPSHPRLEPTRV